MEREGNGTYEGMVVVIALLSQEVEGHQSAIMSKKMGAWSPDGSQEDKMILAMFVKAYQSQGFANIS